MEQALGKQADARCGVYRHNGAGTSVMVSTTAGDCVGYDIGRLQRKCDCSRTEHHRGMGCSPVSEHSIYTRQDVEWWLRDKIQQQNYTTWFHPDVAVVHCDTTWPNTTSKNTLKPTANTINYGDMLHVDFGVSALGLNTDTQHLAYVLHPGETEKDIPQGLLDGLKKGNRMQDIVRTNMKVGSSGNEILKACLEKMKEEGIDGRIYSHSIGDWGHSAGTLIGMSCLVCSLCT